MSAADSMLPGAVSMLPGSSMALDAAVVDAAAAAAAAVPVSGAGGGKGRAKAGKAGKHAAAGNQLSKPRKPLEATLLDLKTNRHMLRLMPPLSAAAAAAAANSGDQAGDQAAAAAAAAGDRAAAAALAPARQWGSSSSMQGSMRGLGGSSSSRDQPAVLDPEAAAAAEALEIKHVPDLLAQEFRPVLPEGDDWLADIVWDRDEAAAAAEEAAAAAEDQGLLLQSQHLHPLEKQVSNLEKLSKAAQQQQQLMNNNGQAMQLGRRARVVWDLNDPHMVFEAPQTAQYSNASAVVQQAAPKVCEGEGSQHVSGSCIASDCCWELCGPKWRVSAGVRISCYFPRRSSGRKSTALTSICCHSSAALVLLLVLVC
jgi:hypothetical protein